MSIIPKGFCLVPFSYIDELEKKIVELENVVENSHDRDFREIISHLDRLVHLAKLQKD